MNIEVPCLVAGAPVDKGGLPARGRHSSSEFDGGGLLLRNAMQRPAIVDQIQT